MGLRGRVENNAKVDLVDARSVGNASFTCVVLLLLPVLIQFTRVFRGCAPDAANSASSVRDSCESHGLAFIQWDHFSPAGQARRPAP